MALTSPKAFRLFASCFFDGAFEHLRSLEGVVEFALSHLTAEQQEELILFIRQTLSGDTTDDELYDLWLGSGAHEGPWPESVREYQAAILRILEELPAKT